MLVEFRVGNFLSFKDIQSFKLNADRSKQLKKHYSETSCGNILNSAFIYGSNSSGKSNFIKAIQYSKKIILNGLDPILDSDYYYKTTDNEILCDPMYFEYIILINNEKYSYGFETKVKEKNHNEIRTEFVDEWLYKLNRDGDECIFEKNHIFPNDIISADPKSPNNSENKRHLFLKKQYATSSIKNSEIITKIYEWFKIELIVATNEMEDTFVGVPKDYIKILNNILPKLDTGITEIVINEFKKTEIPLNLIKKFEKNDLNSVKYDTSKLLGEDAAIFIFGNEFKRYWLIYKKRTKSSNKYYEIRFKHGSEYEARIDEQSTGTIRILYFISILSKILSKEKPNIAKTIFIDEIESSLHPLIISKLIDIFHENNNFKYQLISTTHETRFMDKNSVRNDEIWFIEHNYEPDYGKCSTIYSFKSFDYAGDIDDKKYLDGRFSATPVFTNISFDEE